MDEEGSHDDKVHRLIPLAFLLSFAIIVVGGLYFWKYFSRRQRDASDEASPLLGAELVGMSGSMLKGKKVEDFNWSDKLSFVLNGKLIELTNPDPALLLATFLRDTEGLKGTKLGCEEGGCGACTVVVENTEGTKVAANSCLRLLCSNDGLSVTTVEGIGSVKGGLSEEQKRIVSGNGTQCGFCTPGWVTAMHALVETSTDKQQTLQPVDIDQYFDGNICRCTGYRPILKAFHSFCGEKRFSVSCHQPGDKCTSLACDDIEDVRGQECPSHRSPTTPTGTVALNTRASNRKRKTALLTQSGSSSPRPLRFINPSTGKKYYRPVSLEQLSVVVLAESLRSSHDNIKLIGGNTSVGITKYFNGTDPYYISDEYKVLIDVNRVPELHVSTFDSTTGELTIGAALSLTRTIELLQQYALKASSSDNLGSDINHASTFSVTAAHLRKIANTQVRNMGTWAGNFMTFLQYQTFPSDAVLAFTMADARLVVSTVTGALKELTMQEFLQLSWEHFRQFGTVIVSIKVKESTKNTPLSHTVACSEKICLREHNAHALMNAAFRFRVSDVSGPWNGVASASVSAPICREARIVYGGVSKKTFIATRTERVLFNAPLNSATLSQALQALNSDLVSAGVNDASESPAFLVNIMQTALYEAFLRCYRPLQLPPQVLSAILPWTKPASRGTEVYPVDRDDNPLSPVGKPVQKLEGPCQATGEAVYPSDEVLPVNGLYGAIVYSTQAAVGLLELDVSAALQYPEVQGVFTAADIPGNNGLANGTFLFIPVDCEVPCVGAPLAVVVATSENIANLAAAAVRVTYGAAGKVPIANLTEAIAAKSFYTDVPPSLTSLSTGDAASALASAPYRAQGRLSAAGQYFFYMETQAAIAHVENGDTISITCGTQDPSTYQTMIASLLGVAANQVVVQCQRVGGAFGGKLTGGMINATAAALCAQKLGRSVRIFNTRTADMNMMGAREEWLADYDVGFDSTGKILGLTYTFYLDAGCTVNDSFGALSMGNTWADNAYYLPNYAATSVVCRTNTPPRTAMRAPGVLQACLFLEMIMERISTSLSLPTTSVQQINFIKNGETTIVGQTISNCTLDDVWSKVMKRSQFTTRMSRTVQFNKENLWRKRGVAVTPVKYGMGWAGYAAGVWIGVRSSDGTVSVTHNGCEIGQGINTKVAQAVAMALGIPLDLVRIQRTRTDGVVNGGPTGGSGTSEVVVKAALNACETLNKRLAPYRKPSSSASASAASYGRYGAGDTQTWQALLQSLPYEVSLNVEGWFSPSANPNGQAFQYFVYAACVTEVELNVLTGQVHVLSSELVYDCGRSLNPAVDIGQIEGAVVMALGYFFSEQVRYASGTGVLQSVGTWEYKPPLAQDIPTVFNVTLIANAYNQDGILGSKAVGEPPYIVSNSAYFALKMAVASARADAGVTGFFDLPVPSTIDLRQQACLVGTQRFVMPC